MIKDNKKTNREKLDDAKMKEVSGGWNGGDYVNIDTSDPNFEYATIAENKQTGQKWINYGSGWLQPLDDSTLQYSNQYNNNNYDGPPPLQW